MNEKLKILIVDDNVEFSMNMKDILEIKGYDATTATSGHEALELVRENGYHLALMDIKMPVMNGVETFKKIKNIALDTPVIMMTAFSVEELIQESLQNGAFGIIKKPVDFDKLFNLIEMATDMSSMILMADDDKNICENIKGLLVEKGYNVKIATDGDSAIERARENKFDVMILDMKLPPLNGLETYLAIRNIRPNLTVIIITGYKKELNVMIEDTIQKGAYLCIEKPIDLDWLISVLEEIDRRKSRVV